MMTACFDAAGKTEDKNTSVVLVAGFASISSVWFEFENKWSAVLADFDLPYFHAGDFANCKPPFERFTGDEPAKRAVVSRLLDVIGGCGLRKFGSVVRRKDFIQAKANLGLETDSTVDPYVLCSRYAVDQLYIFAKSEGITSNIRCVFEKGDPEDRLRKHFKKHDFPDPDFMWSKVVYKKGIRHDPFIGLQAAGWLTWEYYVDFCRMFGLSKQKFSQDGRFPIRVFEKMPGFLKVPFLSQPFLDVLKHSEDSFIKSLGIVNVATGRLEAIRREREGLS
jgi:hypothetical protein